MTSEVFDRREGFRLRRGSGGPRVSRSTGPATGPNSALTCAALRMLRVGTPAVVKPMMFDRQLVTSGHSAWTCISARVWKARVLDLYSLRLCRPPDECPAGGLLGGSRSARNARQRPTIMPGWGSVIRCLPCVPSSGSPTHATAELTVDRAAWALSAADDQHPGRRAHVGVLTERAAVAPCFT